MPDTWGDLPKSQIDPSTVDQEIDSKIQTHLDDPDAHIEEGQSLKSHKAAEIIDHLAKSIVEDKLADMSVSPRSLFSNKFMIWPGLESIDAWVKFGTGNAHLTLGCIYIESGNNANDEFTFYAPFRNASLDLVNKHPIFDVSFKFDYDDHQVAYIMPSSFDYDTFGWKIVNDKLYAMVYVGGVEHLTEITGVDITTDLSTRIQGVNASQIDFYINGSLVHSETSYTLADEFSDNLFNIVIKTTDTPYRYLFITDIRYVQDLT